MNATTNGRLNAPRLAVSCAVLRGDEVLVARRGNAPAKGRWAFAGGSVELGETLAEACAREVREETGVVIRPPRFVRHHEVVERKDDGGVSVHFVLACFVADAASDAEPVAADDAVEALYVSFGDLTRLDPLPSCFDVLRAAGLLPAEGEGRSHTQA